MKSKIVSNPNRKQAEKLYLQGVPILKIAKDLNLPYQPLYRHLTDLNKSGISRQLKTAYDLQENEEGRNILNVFSNRIESLVSTLEEVIDVLRLDEDYKKAAPVLIPAIKELRSCYESLLKFEITAKEQGAPTEQNKLFQEQQEAEEHRERLKLLTTQELKQLEWISYKMNNIPMPEGLPDPNKETFIKGVEPESEDIEPVSKDKPFKRTKKPLKQEKPEAEDHPQAVQPVQPTIIPSTNTDSPEVKQRVKRELRNVPDRFGR